MRKYLFYIIFCSLTFVSCEKFLDVKPDENIYENEVFATEKGFIKSLGGVYKTLNDASLYGSSLKYGFLDKSMGYFHLTEELSEKAIGNFDYQYSELETEINGIWSGLYRAIHQTNIIISYLPNIEGSQNYELIAGEAYGLRGFLHLEALKLFGPVVLKEGLTARAIPYYLTKDKLPQPFLSCQEVLNHVETDLQKALTFFTKDPIQVNGRAGNANGIDVGEYNEILDRRGIRMNYYAVKATLARKSQWQGDNLETYKRATELIDEIHKTKAITFVDPASFIRNSQNDLRFASENIFAVYDNGAQARFNNLFRNNIIEPYYENFLEFLYESGTGDFGDLRFNWGLGEYYYPYFSKFRVLDTDHGNNGVYHNVYEVQLIALPELYFMAIEATLKTDRTKSLQLLNTIRQAREMGPLSIDDEQELTNAYTDEVRREYIGEGFLFSHYKRRFHTIYKYGENVPASLAIFKLPIPRDEQIYNP